MTAEILGGIPLFILIFGALISHRIIEPAFLSSIVAVVMLYRGEFLQGYVEKMYAVLQDPSFQLLIMVGIGFAGISAILEKSGGMLGFRRILEKRCKKQKTAMFFVWLLGGIIFIDDYLNALAVSASMKGICDKLGIPREHLAYTVNCMGACVCVLLPFSSWSAFAVGCMGQQGLGIETYIHAIPFMFYPICAIAVSLLLAIGILPKVGTLKNAYKRVENGGSTLDDSGIKEMNEKVVESSAWNFVLPMLALVVGMILCNNDIITGMICCFAVMFVLFVGRKNIGVREFFDTFTNGCSTMTPMLVTIFITFIMEKCTEDLGFTAFLTQQMSRMVPAWILPLTAFLSVAAITFFAASFWTLIVVSFPIFLPMATSLGVPPSIIVGAIMSGVALGSQACLYSDAIFMVASGTGVQNDTQFRTVLPYVAIGIIPASILFLMAGIILS